MNANLNFKFGKWSNLPAASTSTLGTVFVTTDEQAMYIDLPKEGATNGVGRLRIGDIIVHSDVRDITPPYHPGAFYYVENGNALLRYNVERDKDGNIKKDKDGNDLYSWVQINSTEAINSQVDRLQTLIDNLEEADENFAESLKSYLLTETFNTFVNDTYTPTIAGINQSITDTVAAFEEAIDDEAERIEALIEVAKGEASGALDGAKKELQGNIDKKVDQTAYNQAIEGINGSIKDLQDKDDAIDEAMAAEKERINSLIGALEEADKNFTESLEDYLLTETFNTFVNDTYTPTIAGINQSITDTAAAFEEAIDDEAERVDAALEKYLRHDGVNKITGTIELDTGARITNVQDPTSDNDIVSAGYMRTSISNALEALNAMTFKGDVDINAGRDLPNSGANVGDTYIVSYAGDYTIDSTGTTPTKQFARIGDLFINSAEKDNDKPEWVHVSGGLEQYYLQEIRSGTDDGKQFISLTDGLHYGDNLTEENVVGKIYFTAAEDSNLNFSITAETEPDNTSKKTGNHIVTANLIWGTFDPQVTEGEN